MRSREWQRQPSELEGLMSPNPMPPGTRPLSHQPFSVFT